MTIYLVGLEPLENRYTKDWATHIPKLLDNAGANVVIIDGDKIPEITTPGAFIDFGSTNIWKSSQLMIIAQLFRENKIEPNSKFLYTDAWNPTVIQLKYMSSLLQIPIEIHGLWHAGSYDFADSLGRLIGNDHWIRYAELSMFNCYDYNWFATKFHVGMFGRELLDVRNAFRKTTAEATMELFSSIKLTGWPMEYLLDQLVEYSKLPKKQQIVFPHRIAPEKQLNIFKDLEKSMPEYNWIVCQEKHLSKHEYHTILGESMLCFSASNQETLGLAMLEGVLCNAIPLVPDRLSYTEIWNNEFKYPSEWTVDFDSYIKNKSNLINRIKETMENYNILLPRLQDYINNKFNVYFNANNLINQLIK
jgi:hypothetical protein